MEEEITCKEMFPFDDSGSEGHSPGKRDYLILQILDELPKLRAGEKASNDLYDLLYYIYLAPIMPKSIYGLLQRQIKKAIDSIVGRRSMPTFIDISAVFRSEFVRILKEWQHDAFKEFGTKYIRQQVVSQHVTNAVEQQMQFGRKLEIPPPEGCEKQAAFGLRDWHSYAPLC